MRKNRYSAQPRAGHRLCPANDLGPAAGSIVPGQRERILGRLPGSSAGAPPLPARALARRVRLRDLLPGRAVGRVAHVPANGWAELILGEIELCRAPRDHYSMPDRR